MTRASLMILSLCMASAACHATPISRQKARALAAQFLQTEIQKVVPVATEAGAKGRDGQESGAEPCYHVFEREGGGFVMVSGEDRLPAVVAYSTEGAFPPTGHSPALEDFLEAYATLVQEVRQGEALPDVARRAGEAVPVVAPLCQTSWDQSAPYNALCPKDGSKTCPVGCVALAMAQIMRYHEWPLQGKGKVYYTPQGLPGAGMLHVDFAESTYEWDLMLNTTSELRNNPEAAAAVAKLCYDCGVSSRMMYAADGSGTYDDYAIQSMYENFGYKASTIQIVYRDCYATQEEWNQLWKAELDAGRPVLYSGVSGSEGHEFVIDGYDSNDFVHVNWGWGGSANGYFDVAILDATPSMRFSNDQGMIVGIAPDFTGEDVVHAPVVPYMTSPFTLKGTLKLGKNKLVTVSNVYNRSRSAQTWVLGVGLYRPDGELVANLATGEVSKSLSAMTGVASSTLTMNIPSTTPDGEYVVSAIFRNKGAEEWMLPQVVGGAANNQVRTVIADGVASFQDAATGLGDIDAAQPKVVARRRLDLSGRPVGHVTKGIVMEEQTLSDGKKVVRKVRF